MAYLLFLWMVEEIANYYSVYIIFNHYFNLLFCLFFVARVSICLTFLKLKPFSLFFKEDQTRPTLYWNCDDIKLNYTDPEVEGGSKNYSFIL